MSKPSGSEGAAMRVERDETNSRTEQEPDNTLPTTSNSNSSTTITTTTAVEPERECPICLLTCKFPTILPCGHIFCYLCVKGVAYKNRRCAMCRREIPPEFLDRPRLVNGVDDICMTNSTEDGYQWFYEGRNGWWLYDDRTSADIEEAYKKSEKTCTILVAGNVYIVDLTTMLQQRQNEPTRCRRVKRDLANIPKKGVAGLRVEGNTVITDNNFVALAQQEAAVVNNSEVDASGSDFSISAAAADAAVRIATDIIESMLVDADALYRYGTTNGGNDSAGSTLNGENDSSTTDYMFFPTLLGAITDGDSSAATASQPNAVSAHQGSDDADSSATLNSFVQLLQGFQLLNITADAEDEQQAELDMPEGGEGV